MIEDIQNGKITVALLGLKITTVIENQVLLSGKIDKIIEALPGMQTQIELNRTAICDTKEDVKENTEEIKNLRRNTYIWGGVNSFLAAVANVLGINKI